MVSESDCIRSRRELERMTVAHCAVLSVHIYWSDGLRLEGVALIYSDSGGPTDVEGHRLVRGKRGLRSFLLN